MNVKAMENISVYNHTSRKVILTVRKEQYVMEPAVAGVPSSLVFNYKEIEYLNGSCGIIRNGGIRFATEIEQEMYEALRVPNWQNILFEEVIEDIILNPSVENLQRILNVKNVGVMERVKGVLTGLKNNPETADRVALRVDNIIQRRFAEVSRGKLTTNILLTESNTAPANVERKVSDLEEENENMKRRLAEMEAMMGKMMASQQPPATPEAKPQIEENPAVSPTPRKSTRNTKK